MTMLTKLQQALDHGCSGGTDFDLPIMKAAQVIRSSKTMSKADVVNVCRRGRMASGRKKDQPRLEDHQGDDHGKGRATHDSDCDDESSGKSAKHRRVCDYT